MDIKGALKIHHTKTDTESSWDAGEAIKNLGEEPTKDQLVTLHAWVDSEEDPELKGSYKFPHHNVSSEGEVGAANMKGVAAGVAVLNGGRGGANIPDADRKGVYAHLKAHYDDADMEAPELKAFERSKKQTIRMEIKEISEEGTFEGLLSPYGNTDLGGDVVEPGAYTKTLRDRGNMVPMLWQHKVDTPIGELILEDRKEGLWAKGKLLMELADAQKAYLLIKSRIVKGLSIGFETVKDSIEKGIRHLKEIKLYEGSIVTFPMNEMALIAAVKMDRENKDDFNETLREIQTLDSFNQMYWALGSALRETLWSGMDRQEKLSACEAIVEQFSGAFLEFLPDYLDALESYWEEWQKVVQETKEGRTFSSMNMDKISAACDKIKSGHDELMALLGEDKAGKTTLPAKAAEPKSEPDDDHSAADEARKSAESMIEKLRDVLRKKTA